MKQHFEIQRATRTNILAAIEGLSTEQLNQIPEGFNNNIIWNICHILVTQQLLIYGLSETPFTIDNSLIEQFRKGTFASAPLSKSEIETIKSIFISSIDACQKDYENEVFQAYKTYTTSYNITLESAEDAILFNNIHEGLHYGYIMAMKKLVT
ncbi:MAG: DinB family protein [Flavobacteriales bacterium]|nr:DinB family protein [Flavobacteriales bacterium]